jgi:hypothetical protein
MSEERLYYVDVRVGLEFRGEEIPCEETLITPIKKHIKDHLKAYKKTTRIVILDSKIRENGYEDEEEDGEN